VAITSYQKPELLIQTLQVELADKDQPQPLQTVQKIAENGARYWRVLSNLLLARLCKTFLIETGLLLKDAENGF
jgi:hypothetical protein